MGPGPPHLGPGSLGRRPGGPWGGVPTQTPRVRTTPALLDLASFFMTILTSIFDRLGVDLGSVLGVIFGRFGALIGQSWSQSRLRTVLTSKKCIFNKTSAALGESTILRSKSAQDGTQDGTRSPQDGSKMVLDRIFFVFIFRFDF